MIPSTHAPWPHQRRWGRAIMLALALVVACRRAERPSTTATIPPADPRPSPTAPYPARGPVVTTAGSEPPSEHRIDAPELIEMKDGAIGMRPLLPSKRISFRVRNSGTRPHRLKITGPGIDAEMPASIAPGGEMIYLVTLPRGDFIAMCSVAGHSEIAEFSTYLPGREIDP